MRAWRLLGAVPASWPILETWMLPPIAGSKQAIFPAIPFSDTKAIVSSAPLSLWDSDAFRRHRIAARGGRSRFSGRSADRGPVDAANRRSDQLQRQDDIAHCSLQGARRGDDLVLDDNAVTSGRSGYRSSAPGRDRERGHDHHRAADVARQRGFSRDERWVDANWLAAGSTWRLAAGRAGDSPNTRRELQGRWVADRRQSAHPGVLLLDNLRFE